MNILNSPSAQKIQLNQKLMNSSQPNIIVDINGSPNKLTQLHNKTTQSFKTIVISNPWEQS